MKRVKFNTHLIVIFFHISCKNLHLINDNYLNFSDLASFVKTQRANKNLFYKNLIDLEIKKAIAKYYG